MKSLRFKSLRLLSLKEQKAQYVEFHPNRNLIFGMNHVGKSTLTKQIFETLGASPVGKLENWDPAVVSLLTVEIDGEIHHVLRQLSNRALFNAAGKLLLTATRVSTWSKAFGKFLEFNLVLSDKNQQVTQADPACLFLPFYINQDGGWTGVWRSFAGLTRFNNPVRAIVEYFTQIVPPKFYVAKGDADNEQRAIALIDADLRILTRTRERLSKSLEIVGPKLDLDVFDKEVKEVSRQLTSLNIRQEVHREEIVTLQEGIASAEHQIALTVDSLKRYDEDFAFLTKPSKSDLICPTCGAKHEESFLEILNYAEDARTLAEMLIRLRESRNLLQDRLKQAVAAKAALGEDYQKLEQVLETRRGDLRLADVLTGVGSGIALSAFDAEDTQLVEERSKHLTRLHELNEHMKALRSAKRRKRIKQMFQEQYKTARQKLNLPPKDISTMQVTSRPDISGSGGPREILAYYAALWGVSYSAELDAPFSLPIVVDCPAQSGQDTNNLPAMIRFVSTALPLSAQVLLTFEEDVHEAFDAKIELVGEYSLLSDASFAEVSTLVEPLVTQMQISLLQEEGGGSVPESL